MVRDRVKGSKRAAVAVVMTTALLTGCASYETAGPVKDSWPTEPTIAPHQLKSVTAAAPGWEQESGEEPRRIAQQNLGIFDLGFQFYARGLTQFDGPRCEHRPTCSVYSYRAVRKHGLIIGSFMGVDRLMRGTRSSELRRLPIYRIDQGMIYYHDPVEANDFFL